MRLFREYRVALLAGPVFVVGLIGPVLGQVDVHPLPATSGVPEDARYACPMDTHPDETDPARQGAYFAAEDGKCPWCGMLLKPLDELAWVKARRAAGGAEVAYTCPEHQHVYAVTQADCPRCNRTLEPFKVMYTCPDPAHAGIISLHADDCSRCGKTLAAYRGLWLAPEMAEHNVPPDPHPAQDAAYRCPEHLSAHSDQPAQCPVCAADLVATGPDEAADDRRPIPADAKFVCPMEECWYFSTEAGRCPVCGMKIKPIESVDWAKDLRDRQPH
jgi:hypothetical protein